MKSSFAGIRVIAVLLLALPGCGEDAAPGTPGVCPDGNDVQGVCAGVSGAAASCSAACAEGVEVSGDAGLASALAGASAGACVRLRAGSYGSVSVPGGVRLKGASAAEVHIDGVTLEAGSGAALCDLTVGAGGVLVNGATDARIDSVRVSGSTGTGVEVAANSSVSIVASEIDGSALHGVRAADGSIVDVEKTIVSGAKGAAIWAACAAECGCAAPSMPVLSVSSSILRSNEHAGIALFGAAGTLNQVDIINTLGGSGTLAGKGGGGLSAAGCSTLDAAAVRVRGSWSYGVLIDGSSATLGKPSTGEGVDISENHIGLWVKDISKITPQEVLLENSSIDGNEGVGIGVSGETRGFIVCKSTVSATKVTTLPTMGGMAPKEVGDGFAWTEGSEVIATELTLRGNERASMLIDGEALGSLSGVVLSDGDEAKGILQQNFAAGQQPETKGATPPITTEAGEILAVPAAPASLAKDL